MRALLTVVLCAASALAADPFYFGTWKIESAKVAPWWKEQKAPDAAESNQLTGKTVVITAAGITGPRQVACRQPKYQLRSSGPDELFQGMLEEMHGRDKSVDSRKVAASLGFRAKIDTVETGCGNEIDFHFLDKENAAFGLNNYIFYLKRIR